MAKISLDQQIEEMERELQDRDKILPSVKFKRSEFEYRIERAKAVLATLKFVKANEAGFREYIASKKADESEAGEADGPEQ